MRNTKKRKDGVNDQPSVETLLDRYRPAIAEIHELLVDGRGRVRRLRERAAELQAGARGKTGQDGKDLRSSATWHRRAANDLEAKIEKLEKAEKVVSPHLFFWIARPSALIEAFGPRVLLHPWVADVVWRLSERAHNPLRVQNRRPERLTMEQIRALPQEWQTIVTKDEIADVSGYKFAKDELKRITRALDPRHYVPPRKYRDVRIALAYRERGPGAWAAIAEEFGLVPTGGRWKDADKVQARVRSAASRGGMVLKISRHSRV